MRRIAIVEPLHLSSTRIERKILQRVGGERLIDRGLRLLRSLQVTCGVPVYVAAWKGDREIIEAIYSAGLAWAPISEEASRSSDWVGIYGGLSRTLDHYDWVLHTHAACHPFVKLRTYAQAIAYCWTAMKPFILATSERTIAWAGSDDGRTPEPILSSRMLDSRSSPTLIRPSHLGGGCPVKAFSDPAGMVDAEPVAPFGVEPIELLDCDTPSDLELLRLVADGLAWRGRLTDRQVDAPDLWCDGPLAGQSQSATERR